MKTVLGDCCLGRHLAGTLGDVPYPKPSFLVEPVNPKFRSKPHNCWCFKPLSGDVFLMRQQVYRTVLSPLFTTYPFIKNTSYASFLKLECMRMGSFISPWYVEVRHQWPYMEDDCIKQHRKWNYVISFYIGTVAASPTPPLDGALSHWHLPSTHRTCPRAPF